jgi:hypothetical protein
VGGHLKNVVLERADLGILGRNVHVESFIDLGGRIKDRSIRARDTMLGLSNVGATLPKKSTKRGLGCMAGDTAKEANGS